jgi:uncharacterized protein
MYLSINYSKQAAELVKKKQIEVDFFKTPDWVDMIAEARLLRPVCVHFSLKAGRGKLKDIDWELLSDIMKDTNTPYINMHLESKLKDFPHIPIDTSKPIHQEEILEQVLKDIQEVSDRFGAEKVIIENVPYQGKIGKILRPIIEPEMITKIIQETGCGLLLDISHATMTALSLGWDEKEYLSQLPVNAIKELHFTGVHHLDGCYQDHLPALEADWKLLDWVVNEIKSGAWANPWMIAFEYGGVGEHFENRSETEVIKEQIPILNQKIKSLKS